MGYLRGIKVYLFYDPKEQRVLVNTNAHFLEQDYMLDNKPRSKVILDELRAELNEGNEVPILETTVSPPLVARTQETRVPRHSGRVVTCFISLGEIPVDLETDPCNYNEAVQDKDATLWQSAMKTEMESMYSNQVWLLVDPPVKPIGCKWIHKRKRRVDGKVIPRRRASITKKPSRQWL